MPSRLWPHPTPRAAVSLALSISPAFVRGSLHRFLVFIRIPYTTQSDSSQPGRPGRTCGEDTILPFASAASKPTRRSAVQERPRNLWLPSATRFVSTDTVVFTYSTASGAWYPRLTVERAFLCEVD